MTSHAGVNVGCLLVGEYVDEAELSPNATLHRGEVVRPQVVGRYVDLWARDDGLKEFTVLLRDGRTAAVRGHGIKYLSNPVAEEGLLYGIVTRIANEEVFVAIFRSADVIGIFHGEMHSERKTA